MKRNLILITIACICLLALTVYGRQPLAAAPTQWEYKESCNPKESDMNKLGADGWELVSATSNGSGICLFYKRQKQ